MSLLGTVIVIQIYSFRIYNTIVTIVTEIRYGEAVKACRMG